MSFSYHSPKIKTGFFIKDQLLWSTMVYTGDKSKQYHRNWYLKNRERKLAANAARKASIKKVIRDAKSVPCMDCGVVYPHYVMDFDHRDPDQKIFNLSIGHSTTLEKVLVEIDKCDVVCANCHRIRTHGSDREGESSLQS